MLEQEAIGLAGDALQRDARVEQRGDGVREPFVGRHDRRDLRQRTHDGDVATAAAPFLQVGFERVRDVARAAVALLDRHVERGRRFFARSRHSVSMRSISLSPIA